MPHRPLNVCLISCHEFYFFFVILGMPCYIFITMILPNSKRVGELRYQKKKKNRWNLRSLFFFPTFAFGNLDMITDLSMLMTKRNYKWSIRRDNSSSHGNNHLFSIWPNLSPRVNYWIFQIITSPSMVYNNTKYLYFILFI